MYKDMQNHVLTAKQAFEQYLTFLAPDNKSQALSLG